MAVRTGVRTRGLVALFSFFIGIAFATSAAAVTIEWTVTGSVSNISSDGNGAISGFIGPNDPVSLTWSVESDAIDSDPSGATGRYTAQDLVFTIGSLTFTEAVFELRIDNGALDGVFINVNSIPLTGGGDATLQGFNWQLRLEVFDPTGTGFASDALPLTAPDLSVFDVGTPFLVGASGFVNVQWDVDSIVLVPEPGTASLTLMGLAALGAHRRPRRRAHPASS